MSLSVIGLAQRRWRGEEGEPIDVDRVITIHPGGTSPPSLFITPGFDHHELAKYGVLFQLSPDPFAYALAHTPDKPPGGHPNEPRCQVATESRRCCDQHNANHIE